MREFEVMHKAHMPVDRCSPTACGR